MWVITNHQHLDRQQALRRHGTHDAACHRPTYRANDGVLGHALVPRVPLDQVGGRLLDRAHAEAAGCPCGAAWQFRPGPKLLPQKASLLSNCKSAT